MSRTAQELANAINKMHRIREESWDGRRYALSYDQAAKQAGVDPSIADIVSAMLVSGYTDFHDWARETLKARERR